MEGDTPRRQRNSPVEGVRDGRRRLDPRGGCIPGTSVPFHRRGHHVDRTATNGRRQPQLAGSGCGCRRFSHRCRRGRRQRVDIVRWRSHVVRRAAGRHRRRMAVLCLERGRLPTRGRGIRRSPLHWATCDVVAVLCLYSRRCHLGHHFPDREPGGQRHVRDSCSTGRLPLCHLE